MKFTIIIPCYNNEEFIEQSILSALNQSYENTEVIFVDNESSDSSMKIAKKIKEKNPNLKISKAKNIYKHSYQEPVEEGIKISSGDFFTILGADDYLHVDYVKKIVEVLSKSKKIKALQSPIRGIKGNALAGDLTHKYKNLEEFKSLLFQKCPVNTPSIVFHKDLFLNNEIAWNSSDFLGASDYDLYFQMADRDIFIWPFPNWLGYYYRWHENQSTWKMHKEGSYDKEIKNKWRSKWKI